MADVIQVKPQARVRLQKNTGVLLYDLQFNPAAQEFTSHAAQALTVAPSTSVTLSQGTIASVRQAMLKFDHAARIKVNGQSTGVPIVGTNGIWVAYSTSLTSIKVVNESATNTVTVEYVLTN